jgi:shikimate dehydrogenase
MWPSASTRPVVLIGDPVEHSLSPAIHNAAFRELGLDLVYLACRVPQAGVVDALEGLLAMNAAGVNVTLPHKPAAARLASRLTDDATATGVVNTLVPDRAGWLGANTDIEGFLAPLNELDLPASAAVVVLGAGGAARAVAHALLTTFKPERITLAARDAGRAAAVAAELSASDPRGVLTSIDLTSAVPAIADARLLVNATSVGMWPETRSSPLGDVGVIGPDHIVYDLIYTPAPTRLLREAASRGARTIDGREMLLGQAAASFRLWTGREMPLSVARAALDLALRVDPASSTA